MICWAGGAGLAALGADHLRPETPDTKTTDWLDPLTEPANIRN